MRELGAARSLLRQTEPMYLLKKQNPQRYLHLEHVLSRTIFDPREVYPGNVTKEKRRQIIAQSLINEITVAAPSRLMSLLEQSARWQEQQGLATLEDFDVFKGGAKDNQSDLLQQPMDEDDDQIEDTIEEKKHIFPSTLFKTIKFPGKSTYAECLIFSPDGQSLVTGSVDGFIEIWNSRNGKLKKDLKYQAEGNMMAMDQSVICLAYSENGELLVSGSTDGKIAVWKVQSGLCKRRISPAHSQGVATISVNKKTSQILSGSYDQLVKIHDIQSGKLLKEFKGHSSFVNNVTFINNDNHVISGSNDGVVKVWDIETSHCLYSINPTKENLPIQLIIPLPPANDNGAFAICSKSKQLSIYSEHGDLIKMIPSNDQHKNSSSDFISAGLSYQGDCIYGLTESGIIYGYDIKTDEEFGSVALPQDMEMISLCSNSSSHLLAVNDANGHVYLLKP
ncbi:unnamed protein product [Cunninghamella blakesleeana]